jgi:PAS domain S-box-containing protein
MTLAEAQDGQDNAAFLTGGGQVGALMRAHDWSNSPLGQPATWPQSLRSVVALVLNSKFPMFVAWGTELGFLYNDSYAAILGAKHPQALGRRFDQIWSEIWSDISPLINSALAGDASYRENLPLVMSRKGFDEQTYFTFSYSPVRDENGQVAGMYCVCTETTDQVLADRRLKEAQEHQRQMLLQMPGFAAMLSGPDLVYTYVNDAYVAISERTEFVGRRFREVFADIEGQGFFEAFEGAFRTGVGVVTRGMELRLHGREDPQYVDFVLEPIRNEAGAVTGLFVGGYETTDVYRANEVLRASEERYRTLFENIDAAFCLVEVIFDENDRPVDHRFLEVNPAFERQSGLKNALNRRAREVLPDHEQHWFDIYGDLVKTGTPVRFENGSNALGRWFDVHALRVGNPEQRRVAILFHDITERKMAEGRLSELNATLAARVAEQVAERNVLATLLETTDVMVMACDHDFNVLAVNKANVDEFERIYGTRPKVGDGILDLLTDQPEHQAQVRAGWARGLAGEEATFVEDFGDPDRARPYYEVKFRTLRDEAGRPVGAYQFVTDVTQRLREQAELAEAQEALRQSQKMEAMGSLTGGVAHDFNNLLTPIIGSLDMLVSKGIGNDRERRLIGGALQSAERAKTLVQRLLAFARRQPLQPMAVDIARLIEGMADLIGSTLGPTINVRVDIADDLPPAQADANQLEMALLNLAVNARDAMPDGGDLTITARRESVRGQHKANLKPGHYVRLCVHDSGVGMDQETRERAIEPFFSTKGIGKGTGLGLSMVHGLAAQLGGGLLIESGPGQGTTIELWLPISAQGIDSDDEIAGTPPARSGRGTALLVDDEELVRISTADMLTDLGFDVMEAQTAEEALGLMEAGAHPDLLVTDHLMPGMSGVELARAARALMPTLPVLVVSGYAELEGIAPELPRLTKPFRKAELSAVLATLTPNTEA